MDTCSALSSFSMRRAARLVVTCGGPGVAILLPAILLGAGPTNAQRPDEAAGRRPRAVSGQSHPHRAAGLPPGKPMLWVDRGALTPRRVYWAQASDESNPSTRLPAAPFSKFERDDKRNA